MMNIFKSNSILAEENCGSESKTTLSKEKIFFLMQPFLKPSQTTFRTFLLIFSFLAFISLNKI